MGTKVRQWFDNLWASEALPTEAIPTNPGGAIGFLRMLLGREVLPEQASAREPTTVFALFRLEKLPDEPESGLERLSVRQFLAGVFGGENLAYEAEVEPGKIGLIRTILSSDPLDGGTTRPG